MSDPTIVPRGTMRRVRVVQVAYKSEVTGGEQVLLQLVRVLTAADHEVHAVCPSPGPLTVALGDLGARVHVIPMRTTYALGSVLALAELFESVEADLVHTHGMLVNILGRMAAHRTGIPCISTVHVTRDLGGRPRVGGLAAMLKNRFYYRPLDNWTSRYADRVVAVSDAVRQDLLRQGYAADRIVVIPNGIDPAPFEAVPPSEGATLRDELGVPGDAIVMGQVARLSPQKDLLTFVDAVARAIDLTPRVHALVAGEGPERAAIEARIRLRGLGDRIRLLGFRTDVARLMAAFDVFVLSSRWEGLPLTVLEAMASSLPVVATAVDGTREAVVEGTTGLLVPPGDVDSLASAMAALADDRELATRMGSAGHARMLEHFHVDRVAQAHLALYQEVLA